MSHQKENKQTRRFQLCILEPAIGVLESRETQDGVLILNRCDDYFELLWRHLDGSPTQHLTAVFQDEEDFLPGSWDKLDAFNVNCSEISTLVITENPLTVTFHNRQNDLPRSFICKDVSFSVFAQFISELIINGIAVPSKDAEYSLTFYSKCHRGVFFYTPSYIQLDVDQFVSMPDFWTKVHKFYEELISHLNAADILPRDPLFPLAASAQASHQRTIRKVEEYIKTLPTYETVVASEWPSLFDDAGRIKDPDSFRKRIFKAGVADDIRGEALPFIFGLYPLDSTTEERSAKLVELTADFDTFVQHSKIVLDHELDRHKKLADSFRVINHDVNRTDRFHNAFKNAGSPGLELLAKLLRAYALYNPPITYLQGMNDLFVPIILTYLPNWAEDGTPMDKDGQPIDPAPLLPLIFWNFDAMLHNVNHLKILSNVTAQCQAEAREILKMLGKVSPLATIWMKKNQLNELLWLYSEFVLLYKRSFENIWPVWTQFNCSPDSANWLTYFVCASLILSFDEMANLTDVSITTIMDQFPKIMAKHDPHMIGAVAQWLMEVAPVDKEELPPEAPINLDFKYFEPDFVH